MTLIARLSENEVGIIERNGKFHKMVFPDKWELVIPAIDKLYVYKMQGQTLKLPKFSILLKDSFTIDVNAMIKYKIMEPYKARYDVDHNKDIVLSLERLIIKICSSEMRQMRLEEAIASAPEVTKKIRKQVDNYTRKWGFKLLYVEIQSIKKSFLAEQEREKLYDANKPEKGTFMSEKVDSKDHSKVIHSEEESEEAVDFTELTKLIEDPNVQKYKEEIDSRIAAIEDKMDETDNNEVKDLQQQQLEIYKDHQREMVKLHEKDIKKQQEELMFEISQMAKKQQELFSKQQTLLDRQKELEDKKKSLDQSEIKELEDTNIKLQELAEKDELTNLYNRRCFQDEIQQRFDMAINDKQSIALLMIDIDHFKQINDTYGHTAGDEALKIISKIFSSFTDEQDVVCRYGGEEFSIIHNTETHEEAFNYAEGIRKRVEMGSFTFNENKISLTISIGVAFKLPDADVDMQQFIETADKALYQAKETGRNKTILYRTK